MNSAAAATTFAGPAGGIWSLTKQINNKKRVEEFLKAMQAPESALRDSYIEAEDFYESTGSLKNHRIVYVTCHGTRSGPVLDKQDIMDAAKCGWGAGALRWLIFDACDVLTDDDALVRWPPFFAGIRYVLGFANTTVDADFGLRGKIFADYLNAGLPFSKAWHWASQETNPWLNDDGWRPIPSWIRQYTSADESLWDRWSDNPAALTGASVGREQTRYYTNVVQLGTTLWTPLIRRLQRLRAQISGAHTHPFWWLPISLTPKPVLRLHPAPHTQSFTATASDMTVTNGRLWRWWSGRFPTRTVNIDPKHARAVARTFLIVNGMQESALRDATVSVSQTELMGGSSQSNAANQWRTVAMNVTYRTQYNGVPSTGPGGQAEVTLGYDENDNIVPFEAFRIEAPIASEERSLKQVSRNAILATVNRIPGYRVTAAREMYLLGLNAVPQTHAFPVISVDLRSTEGDVPRRVYILAGIPTNIDKTVEELGAYQRQVLVPDEA